MDPKIIKKTQDTLGKIIKKPPLTEKLLGKPPFRFLHDIMTSVIKTTGFMQGLYTDSEMNSENVKDKDTKVAFLQKAIDMVSAVVGKSLSVKPVKIVAGHEPEKTNEFLQALADAINKNVDNDQYVRRVLGGGGAAPVKEEKKERDRTKSADRRKSKESEEKGSKEEKKDGERSRDRGDRDRKHDKDRDRHKEKGEKEREHKDRGERESKTRERSRDGREERHRDRGERSKKDPSSAMPVEVMEESKEVKRSRRKYMPESPNHLEGKKQPMTQPDGDEKPARLEKMDKDGGDSRRKETSKSSSRSSHKSKRQATPVMTASPPPASVQLGQTESEPDKGSDVRGHMPLRPGGDMVDSKLPCRISGIQSQEQYAHPQGDGICADGQALRDASKENESPARVNGEKEEKQEPPSRLQRPASAKGSRRRREEDEEFQKPMAPTHEPVMGEDDLPPQVTAARQLARPSSARPAPPRPKQEATESEPAMRLGTGQPTNLIVDDDDEDEDENFLVEESAPPPPEPDLTPSKPAEEDDAEHGALVKKMLESKKELEGGSQAGQTKKTEIERPIMSDAQRRKQREIVQKEVDKLRASIQGLTRSANPLGKVMDYVQEDLDSMQQELDKWKAENAQHALDLKREMNVTDRAVEPLRQQLTELDRAIGDQLDQIAATKANIIHNDQKISKMLRGIASS